MLSATWPAARQRPQPDARMRGGEVCIATSHFHTRYSITSSARASSVGGTSGPIAFATIRLTTRSNLVGRSTGRSAGFAQQNLVDQVAGAPLKSMKATVPTGVENSYFS